MKEKEKFKMGNVKGEELKTKENKITNMRNNDRYARTFPERFLKFLVR